MAQVSILDDVGVTLPYPAWQPIETAPKGVEVLISDGTDVAEARCYGAACWVGCSDGVNIEDNFQGPLEVGFVPTHWMPLPEPPIE